MRKKAFFLFLLIVNCLFFVYWTAFGGPHHHDGVVVVARREDKHKTETSPSALSHVSPTAEYTPAPTTPSPTPLPTTPAPVVAPTTFTFSDHSTVQEMLQAYKIFHDQARKRPTGSSYKYLTFEPDETGFGNRIRVFIATFLLSLLSGRVFVLHWTEPVPLGDIFEFALQLDSPKLTEQDEEARVLRVPCGGSAEGEFVVTKTSKNLDELRSYDNEEVVHVRGCGEINQPLVMNDQIRPLLQKLWGPNLLPRHVYYDLFRFLLKPTAELEKMMEPVKQKMVGADKVISMHIRTGRHASFALYILEQEEEKFFTCAEKHAATWADKTTYFFLSTDSSLVLRQAEDRWKERLLYVREPIVHSGNQQLEDENGLPRARNGLFKVAADWWLFGEGDLLMPTGGSSYSKSAIWRSDKPLVAILPIWPRCGIVGEVGYKPPEPWEF